MFALVCIRHFLRKYALEAVNANNVALAYVDKMNTTRVNQVKSVFNHLEYNSLMIANKLTEK
jgi:hypothetical protein